MYAVSQRYLNAVRSSGKIVTTADLYQGSTLIYRNLAVKGGTVTADATSDIRRHANIQIVNPARVVDGQGTQSGRIEDLIGLGGPGSTSSILFGAEVVIKSGFQFSFNRQELVPLGRFMVWSAQIDITEGDIISLELYDRAKYLEQTTILKMYDASGKSAQFVIQDLVNRSLPTAIAQTVLFEAGLADVTLAGGSVYDTTHLEAIQDVAEMLGAEFYFNSSGVPICRKKRSITASTDPAQAVYTADCGPNGTNITLSRSSTRDGVYNGVGVYGAQPSDNVAQVYGEAFDMNVNSKTYWQGTFGKAFQRLDRPELTTNQACYEAAVSFLNNSITGVQPASFQMLPNYALETGDLIKVGYPDGSLELHIIDSLDMDFSQAQLSVDTRGRII